MKKAKLVEIDRTGIHLTVKGKKEAERLAYNRKAAGATYG
jgi:Mn-dependent DtxR family transcriptional regulator